MNIKGLNLSEQDLSLIQSVNIFLHSYPQPMLILDINGNVLDCNKDFLEIYSLSLEEIINKNYFSYFKTQGISLPGESIAQMLGQKSQAITFHRVDEKRFLKYLQWSLFEYKWDLSIKLYVLHAHDVTPILEVATKEQLLIDSLIDSLPAEIFWKDKSLVFLGCNKSFLKAHNLKDKSEVIGKTDFDLPINDKDTQRFRTHDLQIINTKKPMLDITERRLFVDGQERYVSTSKVPLFDDQGELYGILGICLDITEHKYAEEKLKQAIELAEQANYTKSEFIANMSHDIRTPLSGVVGISQLLVDDLSDPDHKQQAKWINECGVQLLGLLNDILTVISADNDNKQNYPKNEIFSLRQCVDDLVQLEKPSTEIKGIDLLVDIDEKIPEYLYGDRASLYRILLNLLGNAIKFTAVGTVSVEIKVSKVNGSKLCLHFAVNDTGIGISAEFSDKIFDRFYRGNPSYKGVYSGHGIGLHIAKTYVQRMGGDLLFNSEVGVGTSFYFDLEFEISAKKDFNAKPSSPRVNLPIYGLNTTTEAPMVLIVEDNLVALKVLESIVKLANISFVSANDGESAYDIVTRQNFNLIITDIGLPGISGKELAIRIREWEKLHNKPPVPIVGLTAHGRDHVLDECLKFGMNDVYSKPIDFNTIKEIIRVLA